MLYEFIAVHRDEIIERCRGDQVGSAGLGLGLAFCRWGVETNNGRIYGRKVPDEGCAFTVELPRVPVPAAAMVSFASATDQAPISSHLR